MEWWLILGLCLITFVNRFVFLAKSVNWQPSQRIRGLLKYSSYSVLTAIWFPLLFHWDDAGQVNVAPDFLLGAVVAIVLVMAGLHSLKVVAISAIAFVLLRLFVFPV